MGKSLMAQLGLKPKKRKGGKCRPTSGPRKKQSGTPAERSAACSWCGAKPGQRCIRPSGKNAEAHLPRILAASAKGAYR